MFSMSGTSTSEILKWIAQQGRSGRGVIAGSLCVSPEGIVIAGVKKGSEDCLHLLDHAGNVVASFGGRFDVPSEVLISLPKDFDPGILTGPMGAYYSGPAGEFYLVNPWRYEIRVYRGRQMSASLTHDASYGSYAGGARHSSLTGSNLGFSAGFIGGASVIRSGDVILVFRVKMIGRVDGGFCVDIFRDYKYQSTQDLDIKGLPAASDGEGHIYVTEWRRNGASIAKIKLTVNWPSR